MFALNRTILAESTSHFVAKGKKVRRSRTKTSGSEVDDVAVHFCVLVEMRGPFNRSSLAVDAGA